jgi:hypothetical protein
VVLARDQFEAKDSRVVGDVKPCSWVEHRPGFGVKYCLLPHDLPIMIIACFLSLYFHIMGRVDSSETPANFYQTIRRRFPFNIARLRLHSTDFCVISMVR